MTKKKAADSTQEEAEEVKPNEHWSRVMWKDVKEVYKCTFCGTDRDDVDAMIEHVLTHYPAARQEEMLETLLKEK